MSEDTQSWLIVAAMLGFNIVWIGAVFLSGRNAKPPSAEEAETQRLEDQAAMQAYNM